MIVHQRHHLLDLAVGGRQPRYQRALWEVGRGPAQQKKESCARGKALQCGQDELRPSVADEIRSDQAEQEIARAEAAHFELRGIPPLIGGIRRKVERRRQVEGPRPHVHDAFDAIQTQPEELGR